MVKGGLTTAHAGIVLDVVNDQRSGVQQLDRDRKEAGHLPGSSPGEGPGVLEQSSPEALPRAGNDVTGRIEESLIEEAGGGPIDVWAHLTEVGQLLDQLRCQRVGLKGRGAVFGHRAGRV